jgi:hypothetical protein
MVDRSETESQYPSGTSIDRETQGISRPTGSPQNIGAQNSPGFSSSPLQSVGQQQNPGEPFSAPRPPQSAAAQSDAANAFPPPGAEPQQNDAQKDSLMAQAKETTGQVVDQVQQQATSRIDEQKKTAAEGLQSVAKAVRQAGDNLKQQGEGGITKYAADYGAKAADQLEQLTDYLRRRDVNGLVADVEDFARRRPEYFLAGAFLLGFAGARFLKSSSPETSVNRQPAPVRGLPPAPSPQPSMGVR